MKVLPLLVIVFILYISINPADGSHKKSPKQHKKVHPDPVVKSRRRKENLQHTETHKSTHKKRQAKRTTEDVRPRPSDIKKELVETMGPNYYFIQACCMNNLPINQACKQSLDRFHLVCKEHLGAHPGECKKRASQLYYKYCDKKEDIERAQGWPLMRAQHQSDRGEARKEKIAASSAELMHPVSHAVPLEVHKGHHRVFW